MHATSGYGPRLSWLEFPVDRFLVSQSRFLVVQGIFHHVIGALFKMVRL